MIQKRPSNNDFNKYYKKFIDLIEEDDIIGQLKYALSRNIQFFGEIDADKWNYRYAENKWSVKEVLQHLIDTERIMSYRALRVARNDQTEMPGFEQDDYVKNVNVDNRSEKDIIDEYFAVRKATIALFNGLEENAWERRGIASSSPVTPRALAFIIAGHELHHIDVIRKKYLVVQT